MKKIFAIFISIAFSSVTLLAQMEINGTTLYGNEWIDYDKTYWKVKVSEDGMYKMTVAELRAAGVPIDITPLSRIEMHHFGNSHPIYRSVDGLGSDEDYILFYGKQNRSELDRFALEEGTELFNPEVSLINDEAAYFVSVADEDVLNKLSLVETNLTGNTLSPQPYYLHTHSISYRNRFYKPVLNSSNVQYSSYVGSEGFGSNLVPVINGPSSSEINIPIENAVTNGPAGELFLSLGGNKTGHTTTIAVNDNVVETINNSSSSLEFTRTEYVDLNVDASLLTDDIDLEIKSIKSADDKHRIGTVRLTYPREPIFGSDATEITLPQSSGLRLFSMEGYQQSEEVFVLDKQNNKIHEAEYKNGSHSVILPASNMESEYYVFTASNFANAITVTQKTYADPNVVNHDFIIITHESFMDDGNGGNPAQQYANFKRTELGGSFDPVVIDVADIYDQFGYGVDRHFVSLRNFAHFAKLNWDEAEFIFIIGHSLEYRLYRSEAQQLENNDIFYVPTYGTPGSDVLLAATPGTNTPILPIGRIAARNNDELSGYLDKVQAFAAAKVAPQTIENKLWLKDVMHLSGGTSDIQDRIAGHLQVMEDSIENSLYGANVETFYKKSSSTVEIALSDQIFKKINDGTSIITFFGHSSVGTFDFSLDKVENYNNTGKYPILLSLGCYSGNIHTDDIVSVSKDFVLTPEKGSVAFLASTGSAYIPQQYEYARDLYTNLGNEFYGKAIGSAIRDVIADTDGTLSANINTFLQQLALHGDPSLVMLDYESPDLTCDGNSAKINPSIVDTYQEDFTFCLDIANLGKASESSVDIQIKHISPAGNVETDSIISMRVPRYKQNFCIDIPIKSRSLLGENTILVTIDPEDTLAESPAPSAESNNELITNGNQQGYKFFILSNSAVPTYPIEYGIVNDRNVRLVGSTYNAFDDPQLFHIQLDTTRLFNSPLLQSYNIDNAQGTFSQEVDLLMDAETVYYWRVSQDSTTSSTGGPVWDESSFVYVPEIGPGWNHSHYFQFTDDELVNIEFRDDRSLKYVNNVKDVRFEIFADGFRTRFLINEVQFDGWHPSNNDIGSAVGAAVVVFDPIKGRPWVKTVEEGAIYGSEPTNRRTHYFSFRGESEESKAALVNFLENVVPDGYSVVINLRNSNNTEYNLEEWYSEIDQEGSFFNTLVKEGARELEELNSLGTTPYLFAYVKGEEDERNLAETYLVDEVLGINLAFQITVLWDQGSLTTTPIGPSTGYTKLEWDVDESLINENDSLNIDVIGVTLAGEETDLVIGIEDFDYDLSAINASQYPFIKLRFNTKDSKDFTVAQITKLRVLFDQIPDIALVPSQLSKEEYQEGENISIALGLANNSSADMPPFQLTYLMTDENNAVQEFKEDISAIPAGSTTNNTFSKSSKGLSGDYQLQVIANKVQSPMEIYYHNNLGLTSFTTIPDKTAPVIEVTFDGVQILDQDIVSANPMITARLKDENQYLLVEDTSSFTLLLQYPSGETRQIMKDDPAVTFYPAVDGSNNSAYIEFRPDLEEDGTYNLTVNASDASNNVAGKSSYEVSFRVFNEEMVSNVFNYPNPFSTSTQFVFTLTGDEEPGNLLIRIMTVTGKVVKELTMAELGNVRIGLNRTEYKWDGTDEYGDRLGNGVYFYQVITKKMDGSDYIKFDDTTKNNTDYMFKDGFGKMVIMR